MECLGWECRARGGGVERDKSQSLFLLLLRMGRMSDSAGRD